MRRWHLAFLLLHLGRPLLLEGPSGVGKTELAQALATLCQTELIRLQCYEGLDVHSAVYEWNYRSSSWLSDWKNEWR